MTSPDSWNHWLKSAGDVCYLACILLLTNVYLVAFDIENMYPSKDNAAAIEACTAAVPSRRWHKLWSCPQVGM
jgi:hypothetical protein